MIRDRWTRMNKFRKRVFAVALATAVGSTTLNVGSIAANAGTSARGRVIVAFEDLPEDVAVQTLPVGAKKSDINFPEELEVLLYNDDIEKTEKKDKKTKKKKTVTVTEEVTEEATEVVKKVVKKQVTKKSDDQEEDQEEDQDAVTDEGASQQAGTEGGSTDGTTRNPGTNTEDTGNTAGGGNDTGSSDDSSTGNDGAGDSGSGSDDTGSGNDGGSEDSGSGSDSSEESESSGGSARVGVAGLVSTAAKGAVQAFVPVKAYAAEAGEGEEDRTDRTESVSENTSVSSQDTEKKDEKTDKGSENKDEDKSDTSEDKDSKSKDKSGSKGGNSENRADSDDDDDGSGSLERLSEGEPRTLEDVQWKLDRERSEYGGRFQTVREGDVFFFVPNIRQYGLKSEVDLPTIKVTIVEAEDSVSEDSVSGDSISDNSVSDNTVSENASPEFDQFMIVGGVKVSVTAPEGVFPEGAVLKVKQIDDAASNEKIEQAVKEDMGLSDGAEVNGMPGEDSSDSEEESSAGSGESLRFVSFDITITDVSGNEIQPNTEHGKANVTFSQADIVSDYIEAPGEETEGKLSEGTEKKEENPSGTVTIGGDEEGAGKKTLRVYHFDDDMDNPQKVESSIDSADKAVSAETEHFSPWTIAYSTQAVSQAAGDFILQCSGATFDIAEQNSGTDDKYVSVKITPNVSSGAVNVKVRLKDGIAETGWGLYFESDGGYHDINVTLDNVKINKRETTSHIDCLNLKNGYHYNLNLNKAELKAPRLTGRGDAIHVVNSKVTIVLGAGDSILESGVDSDCIDTENHNISEQIEIDAIDGKRDDYCLILNHSGSGTGRLIHGHTFTLLGGTVDINGTVGLNILNVKGGYLKIRAQTRLNISQVEICGGTHYLASNITYVGSDFNVTGGSLYLSDGSTALGQGSTHTLLSRIEFGSEYKNLPIEEILVGGKDAADKDNIADIDTVYGLNDCYTDDNGNAYLWMPDDESHYIYGVILGGVAGGGIFVRDTGDFTYANRNTTDGSQFVPHNPMNFNKFEVDTDAITFGENDIHKLITKVEDFQESRYTAYPQPNDGKTFNPSGLTNNLYDIEWTVSENGAAAATSKIEITRQSTPFSYNNDKNSRVNIGTAKLNLKQPGVYTLKATLYDKIEGNHTKSFKIAAIKPVSDIKAYFDEGNNKRSAVSTVNLRAGEAYTISQTGNEVSISDGLYQNWIFVVEPSDATNQTVTWSWDPSQLGPADATVSNNSITVNNAGDFKNALIASIHDGTPGGDFVKKFSVYVESIELEDGGVTLNKDSWEYTGKEIKPVVRVESGSEILVEGKDYTVEYKNNSKKASATDPNPPTVIVKGKGKYSGTVNKTFTIGSVSLVNNDVTLDKTVYQYTGSIVRPLVAVKHDDVTLTEGVDYTVNYPSAINVGGPYTVSVNGIGNYSGTVTKTFRIANLPTGTITIAGITFDDLQTKDEVAVYINQPAKAKVKIKPAQGSSSNGTWYSIKDKFYGTAVEIAGLTPSTNLHGLTYDEVEVETGQQTTAGNNYFYVKIMGPGGTADDTTIISTKNIVYDPDAPNSVSINSATVGDKTSGASVTATDALSGISKYYLLVKKKSESPPVKEDVVQNGLQSTTGNFTLSGLSTKEQYIFYAVAEDKAGNISDWVKRAGAVSKGEISATIRVKDYKYDKLQGEQKIDGYYNEPQEIKITAEGNSGVARIEYFITDKFYTSGSAIEGAAKDTKGSGNAAFVVNNWATYNDNSRPYLIRNKLNYIYAKITDNAGGVTYISSRGIWEDEIKPTTSSTKTTPKDTSSEVTVKGTDKESGVKNYYLLARKDGETAPAKAEDVKSAGQKSEDGKFNLTGLTANTKYTLYAVTEDKAGNLSEIKKGTLTTKKTADAAKKDAAKKDAAKNGGAGGSGSGSGSGGKNGSGGSNISKRTAGAGSGDVSGNEAGDELRDGVPYIEDASDGILIGREETSGWDRIMGEVGKASAPAQVFVNMNGSTVVPSDALDEVKDRDVTYYFDMNEDVMWAVNGLSFTADPSNVDFRVRLDTKNIPSKLVNEIADVYPHKNLTLEYDGEFGFTAILSLYLGEENEGMYANLYFYNEDNNSLEFVESTEIDGSGKATFNFLHASDYTVIIRGDALTEKTAAEIATGGGRSIDRTSGGTPANVPKTTGHLWLIIVSIISFLLCGLILFLPDKKRRRRVAGAPV